MAVLNYLFTNLKLNKVWLEARANNPRAIAAYEKVGFEVEGRLRDQEYFKGKFVDCIRLGILKSEWINLTEIKSQKNNRNIISNFHIKKICKVNKWK